MPFGGLFQSGSSRGLDVFCVLSGFVIVWTKAEDVGKPRQFASYISRRLLRIYPPALVMTFLAVMMYASGFGGPEKAGKLELGNLLLSLMLMAERSSSVLNIAWSLKYVVFSYILFGICMLEVHLGVAGILAWQFGIMLHVYGAAGGTALDAYFLQPIGLEFGMGMVSALLLRRWQWALPPRLGGWLLLGGAVGFIGGKLTESYVFHRDLPAEIEIWLFGICSSFIIVGLCVLDLRGWIRVPRLFTTIGATTFSIYLVNYSAIVLITRISGTMGIPLTGNLAPILLAVSGVCCGALFQMFVDVPIQRALRLRGPFGINAERWWKGLDESERM
jgi:peptidoglycan/LPS O-acetylase OafA/YrhL